MTMPNFLVIGAAKAGTTSLRTYLDQHPEIFVPGRGEPSFFAHEGETPRYKGPGDDDWNGTLFTDLAAYEALFDPVDGQAAVGEISPRYLYFEKAPERIAARIPEARLIAILRHPVDRAYSHFLMNRSRGCEPAATLAEAIELEATRAEQGWGWDWSYVGAGLYHAQLQRYFARFPPDRIKVFLYEDLKDQDTFFPDLFDFLGVDPDFRPDTSARHRKAQAPRSYALQQVVKQPSAAKSLVKQLVPAGARMKAREWIMSRNAVAPERLSPEVRRALFDRHFAAECRRLESLIGRSLAPWFR